MKGSVAIGSRRTTPTLPVAAAVVSDDRVAPRNTPCCQSCASVTSGTVSLRRPPKKIASSGTPCGSSHSGALVSHCSIGVQYRELGCEAGSDEPGFAAVTGAVGPDHPILGEVHDVLGLVGGPRDIDLARRQRRTEGVQARD